MNRNLLSLFVVTLASATTLVSAETTPGATSERPTWTSSDNRTIQARFLGVGPESVLIEKDGATFIVPFSRLSTQSVAQAKKLGGISGGKSDIKSPDLPSLAVKRSPPMPETSKRAPIIATTTRISTSLPQASYARMASVTSNLGAASFPTTSRAFGIELQGRVAAPTVDVPAEVQCAIEAGNFLQTKPYKWGGGHGSLIDSGYDCSGSVSHVLIKAGLLDSPLTSRGFASYGAPGPGRWITIYAGPGHAFVTVCGLRLDTGGRGGMGESGPRWNPYPRYGAGWTVRHPPGF